MVTLLLRSGKSEKWASDRWIQAGLPCSGSATLTIVQYLTTWFVATLEAFSYSKVYVARRGAGWEMYLEVYYRATGLRSQPPPVSFGFESEMAGGG